MMLVFCSIIHDLMTLALDEWARCVWIRLVNSAATSVVEPSVPALDRAGRPAARPTGRTIQTGETWKVWLFFDRRPFGLGVHQRIW